MITINATLGTGLYWRSGQILELAGPVAVLVSFVVITVLVYFVMQCISELLCRWPVPGALSVYVSKFIDHELGIAVGIMYWLTYSISFAAIIGVVVGEFHYWSSVELEVFDIIVIYLAIPVALVFLNLLPVKYYGWCEVAFGTIKLLFLLTIGVTLFVLAVTQDTSDGAAYYNWHDNAGSWDTEASPSPFPAYLTAISTAVFAFVGIEVIAACALEAKPAPSSELPTRNEARAQTPTLDRMTRFSAVWLSVIVGAAYTITGVFATLNVKWDDDNLPILSWLNIMSPCGSVSDSAFVLAPYQRNLHTLASVFNAFLIFTAVTCANTNLYIASRTLYGLTRQLRDSNNWFARRLSYFGKTTPKGVPKRAVFLSAIFLWVPFIQLQGYSSSNNTCSKSSTSASTSQPSQKIQNVIDILSELGSVGVVIVWGWECVAFIRYHYYMRKHRDYLSRHGITRLKRSADDYPYRSQGQPAIGYIAALGCLIVLGLIDSGSIWHQFYTESFLAEYLAVIVFFALWGFIKIFRRGIWFTRRDYFGIENDREAIYGVFNELDNMQPDPSE
ncbi:amino acid permease/ SLC12A domain-containing protein [Xylariaceae sp. FL0255]|nr:amino acid permease/ SLC12A domain-containing protein [Xylariaceae sp. FL0255]